MFNGLKYDLVDYLCYWIGEAQGEAKKFGAAERYEARQLIDMAREFVGRVDNKTVNAAQLSLPLEVA